MTDGDEASIISLNLILNFSDISKYYRQTS